MSARERVRGDRRGVGAGQGLLVAGVLLAASFAGSGCYTTQMTLMKSGLDSLRTDVAMMNARDSVAARTLEDMRRELSDQHDMVLATRATSSSSSRETEETLGRLEGKLDDIMARFRIASERQPAAKTPDSGGTSPASGGAANPGMAGAAAAGAGVAAAPKQGEPDPTQLYDQATADLTQGRYAMALGNYREYLRRFPTTDLADNAQYGAGECFFAQAQFDSALVEYARVGAQWGSGDRAPAALYKLGLCQEHLGHTADAKKTFESLVKRFPQSGESQLARDRIAAKP
jgi:tol-pal system protein YbgF